MDDFAGLLVAARRKTGLTQAQVAAAAGLTASYLSFIENRKKPPPSDEVCRRLAEVLDLPARRLLEVAHLERAPDTVRKRVRSLSHSLKRERRSRKRLLESLLSPFLFRGPPGYVESALDTLDISAGRRRRMRDALRAVGRERHDLAAEVASIVEDLPERDRRVLLDALPRLLGEQVAKDRHGIGPTATPAAPAPGAAPTPPAPAQASSGVTPSSSDLPLFYVVPAQDELPPGRYLLEVSARMARTAPASAALREGDRLVVDPGLAPTDGDLVATWDPDGGKVAPWVGRASEPDGGGPDPGGEGAPSTRTAGTVVEIRRPLRRG